MPQVAILVHIFQWGILFQAANNASVESLTSWGFKGLGIENNATKVLTKPVFYLFWV